MKKYRIIFHVDLNAFFASCEEVQDPSLRNKPVGIGQNSSRGILTTANYVARQFGVTSAMSVYEAKKRCPELVIVPGNYGLYQDYSEKFFAYLKTITPLLEPASIDEGYLDVTDHLNGKHPLDLAKEIQTTLKEDYDLPVSIGIAPTRFLAKMASDMKKPLGITILRKRDVQDKLWPLPIESMHGIGKKTVPNLKLLGINTIGDLATFEDKTKLAKFLGKNTQYFIDKTYGNSTSVIDPTRAETVQSVGNSKTFDGDLHEYEAMLKGLAELTQSVVRRLNNKSLAAKTIAVQVRFTDFTNRTKHFTLDHHTANMDDIFEVVEFTFEELYEERPVRLLGVSASNLENQDTLFRQLTIFESREPLEKEDHINKLLKSINENYKAPLLKKGIKPKQ
ncbi:MAG: DNA polymerase IV [Bacillota bacterium]